MNDKDYKTSNPPTFVEKLKRLKGCFDKKNIAGWLSWTMLRSTVYSEKWKGTFCRTLKVTEDSSTYLCSFFDKAQNLKDDI